MARPSTSSTRSAGRCGKGLAADEEFTLTGRGGDKTLELTVRPADMIGAAVSAAAGR